MLVLHISASTSTKNQGKSRVAFLTLIIIISQIINLKMFWGLKSVIKVPDSESGYFQQDNLAIISTVIYILSRMTDSEISLSRKLNKS